MQKITPFLWFDGRLEEAVKFYTSVFRNSHVESLNPMSATFVIEGQEFMAFNGGPHFKFNEAISFQINCETQKELDHYWDKLSEGGDPKAQRCGWLKDKIGLSWQVVPTALPKLLADPDPKKAGRVMKAMLQMKKLDIADLERA